MEEGDQRYAVSAEKPVELTRLPVKEEEKSERERAGPASSSQDGSPFTMPPQLLQKAAKHLFA